MSSSTECPMFGLGAFAAVAAAVLAKNAFKFNAEITTDDGFKNIENLNLPVIDMKKFFDKEKNTSDYSEECKKLAECLHKYGAALVRDPRFKQEENDTFLDQMENYFEVSDGRRDARPELGYQVGVTPEQIEKARDHSDVMATFTGTNAAVSPAHPISDNKWRYFWRMNDVPQHTKYPGQNNENVVPPEFPQWAEVMNMWGNRMMDTQYALGEMLAMGFGLPPRTITDLMRDGPHLLAPTGSDLSKYGKLDTVLAGFHSDLNYLTIHGKSRYPGLSVWTRTGEKKTVKVPDGCFLIQAGKQLEYITGGYVLAGYHEVVVTEATLEALARRRAAGKSQWRCSSTLFAHLASDATLEPLGHFSTPETRTKFPSMDVGAQVQKELEAIKLKR